MELPYQVTISNIDDRYHIEQLYHQTQDAHILANMLYTGNYLVTYDSLGFYKLFLDRNNLDRIDSLLTLQNKHLRKTQPELWKTLDAFISCGQNYSKTAELLFLHPKTVKYRISKLQSVRDLDFEDPEQVFRIMLDSRLFRLQDHFHSEE